MTLSIFAIVSVLAAIAVGFFYLEKYVRKASPVAADFGEVKLVNTPSWYNSELANRIKTALGNSEPAINSDTAETVARRLETVAWLDDVKVKTTSDTVLVAAKYRKPVVMVKSGDAMYYLDEEMVIMDYLPMSKLPIVEIVGFSARYLAPVGDVCYDDDITAAVILTGELAKMGVSSVPETLLLFEIENIDVSNFNERKKRGDPCIVLNVKGDVAKVNWGAPFGQAARYLEAAEKEKTATLYEYYIQNKTLRGVKFIELRYPQKSIPRPQN